MKSFIQLSMQLSISILSRSFAILIILGLLLGCDDVEKPLLYKVNEQDFDIIIPAKGELFAAKATTINAPSGRRSKNIAWLAPEYSLVKKDQVIARLDGEALEVASKKRQNEIAINEQDFNEKNGDLSQQQNAINEDIGLVDKEKIFAQQFSIDDIRIRSKLDILDSMQNTEYLQTKQQYLSWKNDSFTNTANGERDIISMKQSQIQNKLDQLNANLAQLEIKAPHDGLLTYTANWRGEKPKEGQTLWPGQKIAEIPDISKMQIKLQVVETEAIGLATKQKVSFYLNSTYNKKFAGTVANVALFPQTIKRGDPLKYFEVVVDINEQQDIFSPGKKVTAEIEVRQAHKKLIVPLQSIFTKNNKAYAYVYQQGDFHKTEVSLGATSLSHAVITSGLVSGQEISLLKVETN
ncbi:MAG: efflux RND transporter periplasmic adaptor subunit [Colwellia sp.]